MSKEIRLRPNVSSLEASRPGIDHFLSSEFNISNPDRYPERVLMAQYDERNLKDHPFGVAIFSKDVYKDPGQIGEIFDAVHPVFGMKIWEIDGKKDLVHAMNTWRKKYGQASFGLIKTHGNEGGLSIGRDYLTVEDFEAKSGLAKKAFIENPKIVIIACSAGVPGGVGETFFSKMGGIVYSPPFDVLSGAKIEANISSKRDISLRVGYWGDEYSIIAYPEPFQKDK